MTEKQRQFCDEYLIDLNATRAYKAVYKTVKNDHIACVNGTRLLTYAEIKAYIQERLDAIQSKKTASAQEIIEYLSAVMRGETNAEVVVTESVGNGFTETRRFKKAPDEKERLRAAELLGKRYGLFSEHVNISGGGSVVIVDDIGSGGGDDKS